MRTKQADSENRRRPNGEGSVTKLPSGKYMARLTVGPGKRKSLYGRTEKEVLGKLRKALAAVEKGEPLPDARMTVGNFLAEWLEGTAQARLKPSTYQAYQHYVLNHLIPGLGRHRLASLTPGHVDAFLNEKARSGLKPATCRQLRAILRSALSWAERQSMIGRNVAALSAVPRVPRYEPQLLRIDEFPVFLEAAVRERLGALYVTALDTGLRQGELLGLRWRDVSLDDRVLRVIQTRQHVKGQPVFDEPKSRSGRRALIISDITWDLLRAWQNSQENERRAAGKDWVQSGLVFTSPTGRALDASTVTHRFQDFMVRSGLPKLRFHDLRHSSATFLISRGVPMKVVSDRLGHSSISLTLDTYSHLELELQRGAASTMDGLLMGEED